jgi:hypothetical protein
MCGAIAPELGIPSEEFMALMRRGGWRIVPITQGSLIMQRARMHGRG